MSDDRLDDAERDRAREREALVGQVVANKYTITRLIGRGGMGSIYEAEHLGIGKKVALKFIDREWAKDELVASRFAREARAANAIESEHVVTVFDAGTENQRPYLVMELLRGEDLGSRLRRLGRIPVADALHVTAQILRGLTRAHEAGIVHRDLKPDNVFLVDRGDDDLFVKIVDFGISKIAPRMSGTAPLALTQRGIVLGTPLYMSPEQAQALGDVDGRADLFSVGALLFECISGRPPHTGETYEQIIVSICIQDAPDLRAVAPTTPPEVAAFVARALMRDRALRFQSATEMLTALRAIAPDDLAARPMTPTNATAPLEGGRAPLVSGGPPTDVSWTGASTASADEVPAPRSEARKKRPRATLAITALLATIAGTTLTLWIVSATTRPPGGDAAALSARPRAASATTAATTASSASSRALAVPTAAPSGTASTPTPSAAATTSAKPAQGPPAGALPTPTPTRGAATPPATAATPVAPSPKSTSLDIQREIGRAHV